jgi:hypothetical protein
MSYENNGGPAFPTDSESQVALNVMHWEGMSLRDWFAGMAMQGELANQTYPDGEWVKFNRLASISYEIADAMLAARLKTGKETRDDI